MRFYAPLLLASILLFLSVSVGCGKDKKGGTDQAAEQEEVESCQQNSDCEAGWVCLAGECASAASGAIYTDPSHAVTPEKVRRQVEQINKRASERTDKILEGL